MHSLPSGGPYGNPIMGISGCQETKFSFPDSPFLYSCFFRNYCSRIRLCPGDVIVIIFVTVKPKAELLSNFLFFLQEPLFIMGK